ncbi:MAG TPA: AI-2E family transporter [Puia sp.]|nr:AI-2E family transporter [Puia sp.]
MNELPVTVRRSIELLGIFAVGFIIAAGRNIIMPLLLAVFLSILVLPVFRLFRRSGAPEVPAIIISMIAMSLVAGGVGWLLYRQASSLLQDMPVISGNVTRLLDRVSIWVSKVFGYSADEQLKIIDQNSSRLLTIAGAAAKQLASSLSSWFVFFGLLPVYIFFVLLYRGIFVKFISMSVKNGGQKDVSEVLILLEAVVKRYLLGLIFQFGYIIILLGGLLALMGIKHGLLIAILFAFLNLIPYLGPLIGNLLGVAIVLASSDRLWDALIVFGAIAVVQFLDNNILMPRIVGSQVKINALVSIIGIFIGGALAGISGMFLAMPVIAVMKILFDHSTRYRNWGVLLGDERPKDADGR